MSINWRSLIDENAEQNTLAWNIRRIYEWKSEDPPKVVLTPADESYIVSICYRAVLPQLKELFQSKGVPEKLIILIQNYITTINGLTTAIFDENQQTNLKLEPALLNELKSKLELRNEFLKSDWATEDEDSDKLLDAICDKYTTVSSFRALSYKNLDSDYLSKSTDSQKEILQTVWTNGNDLRKMIKAYNLPLSLADTLEAQNIHQVDDLTDDVRKKCVETNKGELKQKFNAVKGRWRKFNIIKEENNRFKANLKNMMKNEGLKSKQDGVKQETEVKERKQRTEEAIKCVENTKKDLTTLTASSKKQLQKTLNDVASKLQVEWQFTEEELNKPDILLKQILDELNKANEQFNMGLCAAYKSDEDIVANISGGIVLYGIQLLDPKRLGEKAQRPLLAGPTYCPLKSPSLSFQSMQQRFTSLEAANKFIKAIESSGLTVAASLKTSACSLPISSSYNQSFQNTSTSTHQNKTQSTMAIQIDYTVIPIKCFQIPRKEMKLSVDAENAVANVNSLQKAKEFLREFHSHVSSRTQHIGGIFIRTVTVETEEETDVQTLEALATEAMNASVSVGGSFGRFRGGAGMSVESFATDAKNKENEKSKRIATITRKIQCIGPPCSDPDLFKQALYSNNSSWYVIDRDALSSFIPIWEIVLEQYSSQPYMIEAANFLKSAWLLEAQDYESCSVVQSEIQRVQRSDYTSNNGTQNIPTIPLHELSSYLEACMTEKERAGALADFTTYISLIISKCLENAIKINDEKCVKDVKNMLNSYGWSNSMDGFPTSLTKDGLVSLFAAIKDVLSKEQIQISLSPVPEDSKNKKLLYSYTNWLVDRSIAPNLQPIERLMDILRHRLEITSFVLPSAKPSQTVRPWGKRQDRTPATTTTPIPELQPSFARFETVYDILIHILRYSDLLSQIELFRLLVERRIAVPILIPSLDYSTPSYTYLMDALSFVNTKLSQQREYNFANDCSLLRIAILSMRPLKDSESSEWIKQVFSYRSLVSLSSANIKIISMNQCIAEIGLGFIPFLSNVISKKYQEVLLLHIIGNYSSIIPYIDEFADVLMVEENPSGDKNFQPWTSLHDDCPVIIWKTATEQIDQIITDDGYCHLSSTVNQTVEDIHKLLSTSLPDELKTKLRSSLTSIVHPDLYAPASINLIDTEKIIERQDFSVVRRQQLPLQQLFTKESENITLKYKNKNNDVEREQLQGKIDDCRRERCEKAYDVEKHPLINCFTGVLSLENRQLRTLTIHQLTQQIEFYSRSAMKALIDQKDKAFNEYDQDQQNQEKQAKYFESKRLLVESTVGIEHLWREVSHLYASHPGRYENYPALAARHLIDGFPLELLDGDAGMLEQTWIKAVFSQLEQQLDEQRNTELKQQPIRIFILSVLGVQSTGKSTLLNLMFGTRLHTSAGMCTRGVNIQLLKAENREEYDYILLLDTEGIRAPEYSGLMDSTWRDNRLATFAILPADATIILINSEDDSAAREVLPIVMLVYQQSELAASSTAQLSTRIFFVYTRVDMNDTAKLVNNIQAMFIDIKNNTMKLQGLNKGRADQNANQILFRDFHVEAKNGEVGGKESDIKFLGKLKKSDVPPDDVPNADYGESIVELNEYIYSRVVSKTSDGRQWKARTLGSFASYLDSIWQCILSADFTLSFKSVMERMIYDKLQVYCMKQRTRLAHLFSVKYDEIEKSINNEQLPDQRQIKEREEIMCENKIQQYQLQLSQMVELQANEIDKEVLQELKDESYQQWYTGSKDNWMAFYNNLKVLNNSRIRQLVTNRISYDSKLIYYQQLIRKKITESFESKNIKERQELLQNVRDQEKEFFKIFYDIVTHAKKNHPPENVELHIQQLYEQNGIGRECDYKSKYKERNLQSTRTSNLDSVISWISSKIFSKNNNSEKQQQEKLLTELVSYVEDLLTPIKHYSDHIVQEAISYTRKKLEENDINRKALIDFVHQLVYTLLVEQLTEKQHEWERTNSISVRLEGAKDHLWNFYCNTIKGIVGVELLTSDLKIILLNNYRLGLKQKIVRFVVLNLHKEAWVMDSRMLMAHADLDLLKRINAGKTNEVIQKVTDSSKHYQKIVNRLLQQNVTNCAQDQLDNYHNSLESVFCDTVVSTKAYHNPISDQNEKDETKISQGRTMFFLKDLIKNLHNYQLPIIFADAVQALNHENYVHCDSEPIEIWEKMANDLLKTVPKEDHLKFSDDESASIIKDVLDKMINHEKNETVKMRCSEPCPLCKMPCKRDLGHTSSSDDSQRRHDCDHQSTGLGGRYWGNEKESNYRELPYESCSNHVAANNRFQKDGEWYSYKTFADHYPWLTPRPTTEALHEVRQYIFYNYQQQLAAHYKRLPCSNIPSTFNHPLSVLKSDLKKIINENSLT